MTVKPALSISEDGWQQLFGLLQSDTGHDCSVYKTSILLRRLEHRMYKHKICSIGEYLSYLQANAQESGYLFQDFLIGVTSFYRDHDLWNRLRYDFIASLIQPLSAGACLRIWVPGCSTGEEAYSLAIILFECMEEQNKMLDVQIFATDLDDAALSIARKGSYPEDIVNLVPFDRRFRFFHRKNGFFLVNEAIRKLMVFTTHDVVKDPPFCKLNMISCRNVLIYLKADIQKGLLSAFHCALQSDGFLVLGPCESIGESTLLFATVDRERKIYKKISSPEFI